MKLKFAVDWQCWAIGVGWDCGPVVFIGPFNIGWMRY